MFNLPGSKPAQRQCDGSFIRACRWLMMETDDASKLSRLLRRGLPVILLL
jgi:hypothetical protein